jgi:hypothetical protein
MTPEQFRGYLNHVSAMKRYFPHYRMGQCYFNALHDSHPEIANLYRGGMNDCFYRDSLIGDFLSDLYENHVTL